MLNYLLPRVNVMVTDVVMPRFSLTMQKGTIVKWLKNEGDAVEKGMPIVEVEADKVTTEVESPVSGILLKICAQEQTDVPVGKPLAFLGKLDESIPENAELGKAQVVQEKTRVVEAPVGKDRHGEERKTRASPVARKLAKQYGIDLAQMQGTGPGGRITSEDVLKHVELHKDPRTVKETVPVKGVQKTVAERMTQSIRTAAHCSVTIEVDASRMLRLRREVNAKLESEGKPRISYTDILVKALATALKDHPVLNSSIEGDQLKIFEDVNVGFAVEAEIHGQSGLMVPVIRKADKKSLLKIAEEARGLIERVREGKASHEDLSGGTFTVTNLGMYGIETFIPIINPPEAAILGVGAIIERPVFINGEMQVKPMVRLTLSFDHRVVNGAPAAKFMQSLKNVLEEEICES
jgi:pyruvate dehydrogenase E2 component (dihydrolipoamide acetyltransferase)